MIRKVLTLGFLAIVSIMSTLTLAQTTTTVSATVTDTNSTAYASGSYSISLVDSNGNPLSGATLCASGNPLAPASFTGALTTAGSFSIPITPSASICPSGTKWNVQICSQVPPNMQTTAILYPLPHCFSSAFTISGSTQSLSSTLSGLAPIIYWINMNTGTGNWIGGGGGSFTALTGDATSTSTGGATTVKGINGTLLSSLASGVLYNTTSTGVPSIATASQLIAGLGSTPVINASAMTSFPTFNQNTTGNAATATNISTSGTGNQVWGMNSGGSAQGWQTISGSGTVNSGTTGQEATYLASGTAVSGDTLLAHANSTLVDTDTNGFNTPQIVTSGSLAQIVNTRITNDGTTGTTALTLAIINSSGNAITATTSNTGVRLYPVIASITSNGITTCAAGTSGNACLVLNGEASITFDASGGTAGHYVGASTATAGDAEDLGTSISGSIYCVGKLLTSPAANTAGTVALGDCPAPSGSGDTITSPGSTISVGGTATATTLDCVNSTTSQLGCVKPDGTSITVASGVISAPVPVYFTVLGSQTMTAATNYYFWLGTTAVSSSNATTYGVPVLHAGTLNYFWANADIIGSGDTITYTLMKNGGATTLTCAQSTSATACTDATHTASVAQGDVLEIRAVCSSTCGAASMNTVTVGVQY